MFHRSKINVNSIKDASSSVKSSQRKKINKVKMICDVCIYILIKVTAKVSCFALMNGFVACSNTHIAMQCSTAVQTQCKKSKQKTTVTKYEWE